GGRSLVSLNRKPINIEPWKHHTDWCTWMGWTKRDSLVDAILSIIQAVNDPTLPLSAPIPATDDYGFLAPKPIFLVKNPAPYVEPWWSPFATNVYVWYPSRAGTLKPKAQPQGVLHPIMGYVKGYGTIQTHTAVSLKSQDAIAAGEGRKVKLFKEFPDYYAGQATKPEEEDDAERKIEKGACWERKTWKPYVKLGKPANDDPRKRQPCVFLPKPDLKKKCTVEERRLWQRTLPEPATMRVITYPQIQYSNPELEQWHADLSRKARALLGLKSIEGKILKYHETDEYWENGIKKHFGMDVSVEHFKQLGLWNGGAYPTGAHSKIRWSLPYTPLIPVILENVKSQAIRETVETLA
ncbi:MAG: hypothetical protein WBF54_20985, partial [Terriglobales bacterium]